MYDLSDSPKQRRLLVFIHNYIKNTGGVSPYQYEMCEYMGMKHQTSIINLLNLLEKKGFIRRSKKCHQSVRVLRPPTPEMSRGYGDATKWAAKGAKQGDAEAQYRWGRMLTRNWYIPQNLVEAMNWFRKAAEQGHISAMYELARCFYHGEGVRQNPAEAAKWLRKAAGNG